MSAYRTAIWTWIFVAVSFLIGLFVLNPVYVNVCEASKDGAPQKCEPNDILYVAFLKIGGAITHAEFWTALATIAVAIFTFTLKRSTDRLWKAGELQRESSERIAKQQREASERAAMRQSMQTQAETMLTREANKTARIAADAAMLSAKAAIGIELPIIRIKPPSLFVKVGGANAGFNGVPPIGTCWADALTFSNRGRTKAFPVDVVIGWYLGEALPHPPTYDLVLPFHDAIWEPDPTTTPRLTLGDCFTEISADDHRSIQEDTASLWFYCCLTYEDFLQDRHETAVCWRWVRTRDRPNVFALKRDNSATSAYNRRT